MDQNLHQQNKAIVRQFRDVVVLQAAPDNSDKLDNPDSPVPNSSGVQPATITMEQWRFSFSYFTL